MTAAAIAARSSRLPDSILRAALAEAARAPSAHNTQPARWRCFDDGSVLLLEDRMRRLPASDPTTRDHWIGLGAAFEGLSLALGRRGWHLSEPVRASVDFRPHGALAPVARAAIRPGGAADPLAAFIERRRTHRGLFDAATPGVLQALADLDARCPDLVVVDREAADSLGREHDACIVRGLSRTSAAEELRYWIRTSRDDPRWYRDGLTAECLLLSRVLARWVHAALAPRWLPLLRASGLLRVFASERSAVRSATALVVLHRPASESAFDWGRRFYRLWLELASLGLAACPMSALVDDPRGIDALQACAAIDEARAFVQVLRVGPIPDQTPRSPRLPVPELLA